MICPHCDNDQFFFRLPNGPQLRGSIPEKAEIAINLLTDLAFNDPGEPEHIMTFTCTCCGWCLLKPGNMTLYEAYVHAKKD